MPSPEPLLIVIFAYQSVGERVDDARGDRPVGRQVVGRRVEVQQAAQLRVLADGGLGVDDVVR